MFSNTNLVYDFLYHINDKPHSLINLIGKHEHLNRFASFKFGHRWYMLEKIYRFKINTNTIIK
jgi:hypothetical protein